MIERHFVGLCALALALLVVAAGCEGGAKKGIKVTGSATQGGQPLESTRVNFITSDPAGESRTAVTDASGKFETVLLPGTYKVTLSRKVDMSGKVPGNSDDPSQDYGQLEASGALKETIPMAYTEPSSTPLSAEITSSTTELPAFAVEGK